MDFRNFFFHQNEKFIQLFSKCTSRNHGMHKKSRMQNIFNYINDNDNNIVKNDD